MQNRVFSAAAAFAHRNNLDGTWDSICTKCFLTVASERAEGGLLTHERRHNCDSLLRARHANEGYPEPLKGAGAMLEGRQVSACLKAEEDSI
jgi:hypothetical protein